MKLKRQLLVMVAFCFAIMGANAQEVAQGVKLPRLTTAERDLIQKEGDPANPFARGQVIFNLDNACLEFWNSTEWVSLCDKTTHDLPIQPECGAFIAPGVWKKFMCHNLGADYSLDPFTPAAGLHGAKYRWGTKDAFYSMADDQINSGSIPGWTTDSSAQFPFQTTSGDWEVVNNPCPAGFHVPTQDEWDGVVNNNTWTSVGDWTGGFANYSSGVQVGTALFLPAAGLRNNDSDGALSDRGDFVYYWSSTGGSGLSGLHVYALYHFYNDGDEMSFVYDGGTKQYGSPVRCIAD